MPIHSWMIEVGGGGDKGEGGEGTEGGTEGAWEKPQGVMQDVLCI